MTVKQELSTFDMSEIAFDETQVEDIEDYKLLYIVVYKEVGKKFVFEHKKVIDNEIIKQYSLMNRLDSVTDTDIDKDNPELEEQLKFHIEVLEYIEQYKACPITFFRTMEEKTDDELIEIITDLHKNKPKVYDDLTIYK